MRERTLLAGSVAVFVFALALRLIPLVWSPLPFNPDGLGYAALVRDALATGGLPLAEMATDEVGFTSLLAVVSALAGESPLTIAQPTSATLGAASVLVGAVFARRLALGLGRSRHEAATAALLAGTVLAVEGVYLFRSTPTDEQTAAFVLVPTLVLATARWLGTGDREWGLVAGILFVILPPLHNLSGLVAAVSIVVVGGVTVVRQPTTEVVTRAVSASLTGVGYLFGYHLAVEGVTAARIVQADRLVTVPGLFAAWVVLAVLAGAWYVTTSERIQRGVAFGVLTVIFGLVAVNAVRPVFPTTPTTSGPLLGFLLPLAVPATLAGLAAFAVTQNRAVGASTLALVAGPLTIVGTALTAALTFDYLAMLFRAHLFVHVPLVALAGVGTVVVRERPSWVRVGLAVALIVSAAVSAPVAFAGLDLLPYKSVTTEAEFTATEHASTTFDALATDDHLRRVAEYYAGDADRGPVYRWLRENDPPPTCPVLSQRSWTTTGAQFYPQPPATLSASRYETWKGRNDVVSVTISSDPLSVVVPRTATKADC